jgi:hypothetical protein
MNLRAVLIPALAFGLTVPGAADQANPAQQQTPPTQQQPPQVIDLDAATVAAHTDAARSLIPLLEPVRDKATQRLQVERGSVPDSPFTGTQTTLFAVTIGKKNQPVDPQVVQAMEKLLAWEPADRSAKEEAALFDTWMAELSRRASAMATKRGIVACDTNCVVETITALDDAWGKDARERSANREQVLFDTFVEAVKKRR